MNKEIEEALSQPLVPLDSVKEVKEEKIGIFKYCFYMVCIYALLTYDYIRTKKRRF